jgi:hypothetical protein
MRKRRYASTLSPVQEKKWSSVSMHNRNTHIVLVNKHCVIVKTIFLFKAANPCAACPCLRAITARNAHLF